MTRAEQANAPVRIEKLQGLWSRSLLVSPDGARDATTRVAWLQGPNFYADLRQPESSIALDDARSLRDLEAIQVAALAAQDGFAGILLQRADHFEWTRNIDFLPRSTMADRGRLEDSAEAMVEYGLDADYVEHWHREAQANGPNAALALKDHASDVDGLLVRAGPYFMVARSRPVRLAGGPTLPEMVRDAPTLAQAQDLVDCELSLGCATDAWTIQRSSLPYRVDADLEPHLDGDTLTTADISPDGHPFRRSWSVTAREGEVADCFGRTTR